MEVDVPSVEDAKKKLKNAKTIGDVKSAVAGLSQEQRNGLARAIADTIDAIVALKV